MVKMGSRNGKDGQKWLSEETKNGKDGPKTAKIAQRGFDPRSSRLWAWHANHCATEIFYLQIYTYIYFQIFIKSPL